MRTAPPPDPAPVGLPRTRGPVARVRRAVAALGLLAGALSGCGAGEPSVDASPTQPVAAGRLRILTPYGAEDGARFREAVLDFERTTGVAVEVVNAGGDFVDGVTVAERSSTPPDLAVFPQPALFEQYVRSGALQPLPADLAEGVRSRQEPGLVDLATIDGAVSGVWLRASPYSILWYRRDVFEREGWVAPATAEELDRLTDEIRRDGRYAPWCIGAEAGGATGWVLTDWVEQYLITLHGPAAYDDWAARRIPMTAEPVVDSVRRMADLVRTPGTVLGGPDGVLATPVERSADEMVAPEPGCLMHRQADWIVPDFGAGATIGPSGMIQPLPYPGVDAGAAPALVGGDIVGAFADRPEVWQFLNHLTSEGFGADWAGVGGFLSPNLSFDTANYTADWQREVAGYLHRAPVTRFDAADLMPPEVGSGLLWAALVRIVEGAPVEETLAGVERDAARLEEVTE